MSEPGPCLPASALLLGSAKKAGSGNPFSPIAHYIAVNSPLGTRSNTQKKVVPGILKFVLCESVWIPEKQEEASKTWTKRARKYEGESEKQST
jgi:hypothetical protein